MVVVICLEGILSMAKQRVNMDSPNIVRAIILYAIPLMLINLISSLFNSVDMIMLDAFDVGETSTAVASVGATSSIVHFIVNSFLGIGSGAKIVLAHQLGAHHKIQVRRTISTAIITAFTLGITVSVVGFFLSGNFLVWTKCPSDCIDGARAYLQVYMLGVPAIMVYNFATAIITAGGDTKRPLYYMIISGGSNVILNFIFLMILDQKVLAVAIATAASQYIGAALCMARLMRSKDMCSFSFKGMRFSLASFKKIMKNGLPLALSSALFPLSNLQIQTQINELGSSVVAGSAAAANIESIVASLGSSAMTSTVGVFVGYNIGAKRPERVKKSIITCLVFGMGISAVAGVICTAFSTQIASLYVSGDSAIKAAQMRMLTNCLMYFIASAYGTLGHVIQSFGYAFLSTFNSIFWVFGFRLFWMFLVYPPLKDITQPFNSFFYIAICWPISWLCLLLTNTAFFFFLYYKRFKRGRLKEVG